MPRVNPWTQRQDLERSIFRAHRSWETVKPATPIVVWRVEAHTEPSAGRKPLLMGTISMRGTWAGDGVVTCSIQ